MRRAACILAAFVAVWTIRADLAMSEPQVNRSSDMAPPPPWQGGANNDAERRGLNFTVPDVDNLPDFHGSLDDPKLVLYVGGNYFFAMAPLVKLFEAQHSQFKGRLFWETIPPGLLAKQMEDGGTITVGNMTFTAKPDIFLAGLARVQALVDAGKLETPAVPYVTNTLTIMVPAGNPAQIKDLADLGQAGVKLAMPNPEYEGIARQIKASLKKAGGDALVTTVYRTKVENGSTILTRIHHRQTPMMLMNGDAQAGVTWLSEALFQERVGHPITHVDIAEKNNSTGVYAGALVKGAAHPDAAKLWLAFIASPPALRIFESYGFKGYSTEAAPANRAVR